MKFRTALIYIIALIFLVIFISQWFFKYPDISQLIFGIGLSLFITACGYLWEWMDIVIKHIENLSYRIDSISLEMKGGNYT